MLKKYRYKIYGLTVESELEIPQAVPTLEDMNGIVADVEIVYGEIPEWLKKAGEEGAGSWINGFDAAWFNTKGTAQYLITRGNKIVVRPYEEPDEKLLVSMILSAGMSLILLQRNEPVIHGSVIEKNGYAYIISGTSGAGKSTVTMELLNDKELMFMADDTVRLTLENGVIYCHPTYPQQKVCRDLACRMGLDLKELIYIDEGRDKFALKRTDRYYDQMTPLKGIYILDKRKEINEVKHEKLQGIDYVYAFIENLYLADNYRRSTGIPSDFMSLINILYHQADIYRITRPENGNTVKEVVDKIRFLQSC